MQNSLLTLTLLFLITPIFNSLLAQPISFERHKIANIATSATSIRIHPADLDNDGDQDILTADALGGNLFWWESSGGTNPTFTKHLFATGFPQAGPFFTADVNGDGHLDILITSFTGDKVVWWRNDGNPDPSFIQEILQSGASANGALKVIAADLDQDGDTDVAAVSRVSKQLRLFINDGNLIPSWTHVVLSSSLTNVDGLAYGDFTADGLMDLIVAHPGNAKVTMFKGSTTATNGFTNSVIQFPFYCKNIYGADMNGDGNLDVLNLYQDGHLNKIGYLENSGGTNPTFTNKFVGTYDNSFSIFPVDLDSDGDMDVLGGSNWEDGFRWWENQGGTNPSFQSHLIEKNFVMAWTAKPADMDNDGDLDFVASTGWAIHWFENDLIDACELSFACKSSFDVSIPAAGSITVPASSLIAATPAPEGCGVITYTVNGQASLDFDCADVGTEVVTLIGTDEDGNTHTCNVTLNISDDEPPHITCPGDQSDFFDDNCEYTIPDYTGLATASDNCSYIIIQTPSEGTVVDGDRTIILTAVDPSGNTHTCIFDLTLSDNDAPIPVCLDPTITFNGEATIDLTAADIFDELASSDNCTDVILNNYFPTSVSCEELGSIIPVTVSVSDENGNGTSCTAFVTVDGLPCGWSANPDGIGCPDGNDPSYDPISETFSISSEGCYDPNYYSNSDSHGFASTELCGDGEIIAQVTQVSGSGWAGVSMRESLSPGAKMLQLSMDGVSLTKRELRQSTGGIAFNHLFQTQGNTWLRLTRSGNLFTAQHSSDGTNWATVIAVNIPMASCIQVGLITENKAASGSTTATFSNVDIKTGISPLSAPEVPGDIAEEPGVAPRVNLYPNPARDEAWIDLGNHFDQVQAIEIYNNLGQLVESVPASAIGQGLVRLAMHNWDNGLYLVRIKIDEQTVVTRRLVRRE